MGMVLVRVRVGVRVMVRVSVRVRVRVRIRVRVRVRVRLYVRVRVRVGVWVVIIYEEMLSHTILNLLLRIDTLVIIAHTLTLKTPDFVKSTSSSNKG